MPMGLVIYGWTAENVSFWFWPNLGVSSFCTVPFFHKSTVPIQVFILSKSFCNFYFQRDAAGPWYIDDGTKLQQLW